MATKYITKLGKASPDAIQTAMRTSPLSAQTIRELKMLSEAVVKAPPTTEGCKRRRTPEVDFTQLIVPMLDRVVQQHGENPQGLRVDAIEGFHLEDVSQWELVQLIQYHATLVSQEASLKTRILLVRYQRGLIYLRAHHLINNFRELRTWFDNNFYISYKTATAYMSVASLLRRYPIILKCGLSFEQVRRHNKRLNNYFEKHQGEGVDESCDVSDGVNQATIQHTPDFPVVPDRATLDADFEMAYDEENENDFPNFTELTENIDHESEDDDV